MFNTVQQMHSDEWLPLGASQTLWRRLTGKFRTLWMRVWCWRCASCTPTHRIGFISRHAHCQTFARAKLLANIRKEWCVKEYRRFVFINRTDGLQKKSIQFIESVIQSVSQSVILFAKQGNHWRRSSLMMKRTHFCFCFSSHLVFHQWMKGTESSEATKKLIAWRHCFALLVVFFFCHVLWHISNQQPKSFSSHLYPTLTRKSNNGCFSDERDLNTSIHWVSLNS